MQPKSGYTILKPDASALKGEGTIADIDISAHGTTACSGNMVLASGTVGSDERKIADGARYRKGTG